MTLASLTLQAKISGVQSSSHDLGALEFQPNLAFVKALTNGTGANQADLLFADTRTLAASATEDLDLAGVLTDAFGAVITMVEVVAILITADAANTNNVVVGDATSPVPLFGGTNGSFAVKPGGMFMAVAPNAAGLFTVGAGSTDDLKITNSSSGTGVTYSIVVVGRSA
ncbi:MAG: hypothetical protein EOS73_25480 [Mesorhizobium sp.]|nr:MAG: hypothetical protein EOS73_25480 [Mesorhizobium sp.]